MEPADISKFGIYIPQLEINNERSYAIVKGGENSTYYVYPASTNNNTTFNFNIVPPSKQTVLDRVCYIQVPMTIDFTGTAVPGFSLLQPGYDALRAFPISSVTNVLTATINGLPINIELREIVHLLTRFHTSWELKNGNYSIAPQMTDTYQFYSQGFGTNNNSLGTYVDNTFQMPRGAYAMGIPNNTATTARITVTVIEPVILPPFLFDNESWGGLTNIDTLQFTWIFNSNLSHVWSHVNSGPSATSISTPVTAATISSVTVNFGQPNMLMNFITPRLTQPIPKSVVYPYYQINKYIVRGPTTGIDNRTGATITTQNIMFNSIPRKIYLFAKQSDSQTFLNVSNSIGTSDTFAGIRGVRINWNNNDGVLSAASQEQLYYISRSNGCNLSWTEWKGDTQYMNTTVGPLTNYIGTVGGPLCIEPGKDLPLRDDEAPGVLGQYNFQAQVDVFNLQPTGTGTLFDLYVIAVYEGTLTISGNSAVTNIGAISRQDVLNAPITHDMSYNELEKVYGGDFFSRFKSIAKGIGKGLKFAKENILPLALGAKTLLGYGEGGEGCPPVNCPGTGAIRVGGEGGVALTAGARRLPRRELVKRLGR